MTKAKNGDKTDAEKEAELKKDDKTEVERQKEAEQKAGAERVKAAEKDPAWSAGGIERKESPEAKQVFEVRDHNRKDPREPEISQADLFLGGQGKAQHEAQAADKRRKDEEKHDFENRAVTGRTLREQEAGRAAVADHESGKRREREAKTGKKALETRAAQDAAA